MATSTEESSGTRLNIAIVGAGVIGCVFALAYRKAGHNVTLVDVDEERVQDLAGGRVVVELPDGTESVVHGPALGYPLPKHLGRFDLVQISVKGYDTARAARDMLPLVAPDTVVLSVQNGLGNLELLAGAAGPERVVGGITAHSGQALGPRRIRYVGGTGPLMVLGPHGPEAADGCYPLLRRIEQSLTGAGFVVELIGDIDPVVWKKLIANVATNPVAALTGRTGRQILSLPPLCALVDLLAEEAAAVARARGLSFDEMEQPGQFARWALAGVRDNKISMLQDVEARRPTEIGNLNEAVCAEGERLGVPTPTNRSVSLLVRAVEQAYG